MRNKDILFIIFVLILLIGSIYIDKRNSYIEKNNICIDTILQIKQKDSIVYNLIKQDSIIYLIRKEMKYEIEKSINNTDSIIIKQFKELVSE